MTPEQKARLRIDELLAQAGWQVCNLADAEILELKVDANIWHAQVLRQALLSKLFAT